MNFVFYKPVVPISGICTSLAGVSRADTGSARFISKQKKTDLGRRTFPVLH